jgi:hypothetical protein
MPVRGFDLDNAYPTRTSGNNSGTDRVHFMDVCDAESRHFVEEPRTTKSLSLPPHRTSALFEVRIARRGCVKRHPIPARSAVNR